MKNAQRWSSLVFRYTHNIAIDFLGQGAFRCLHIRHHFAGKWKGPYFLEAVSRQCRKTVSTFWRETSCSIARSTRLPTGTTCSPNPERNPFTIHLSYPISILIGYEIYSTYTYALVITVVYVQLLTLYKTIKCYVDNSQGCAKHY